jgi:hypothetical protein
MNDKWEDLFPMTNLRKRPRLMSDHNPLLLCTDQTQVRKTRHFCFEIAWIKHADFIPKVKEIRGESITANNAVEKWYIKLNRVKKFLKGWEMNLKGHTRKYRETLQQELADIERMEEDGILPRTILNSKTFIQS